MANSRGIFLEPPTASHELRRLVQDQLLNVLRTTAGPRSASDDLSTTVEKMSTLADTCKSVLESIDASGEEIDPRSAVEQIRNVLDWNELLDAASIKRASSRPNHLFRAHKHVGRSDPTFSPDLEVSFNLDFRRIHSIDDFAILLGDHLSKTQEEKDTGQRKETSFLSMSSSLEWTMHTAGQKWRDKGDSGNNVIGLAVFDVEELRRAAGFSVLRVSSIFEFLATRGKGQHIKLKIQKWARNCDEYVSIGEVPRTALRRWARWRDLWSTPFLPDCFLRAYTLGMYRAWLDIQHIDSEIFCQMILKFGIALAGTEDQILRLLIGQLLKPGSLFWGYETDLEDDAIQDRVDVLVRERGLDELSRLSIKD